MDRVSIMQESGKSYSVKFLELTRIYSKNKNNVICIFEGQDEKYFSSRIDSKIGKDNWFGINSGGRKPVLDLYGIVSTHKIYSKSNYCCFIDHDFQDWFDNPNPQRIYITNGYSIENYYVNESAFKKVLSSEFGVTEFNDHKVDFDKCIMKFNSRLEEFILYIQPFNCWVKAHRIMEYKKQEPKILNVTNIKTTSLIDVTIDKVVKKYEDKPETVFKDYEDLQLCTIALTEAENSFKTKDLSLYFRGKQQLDFFRLFLMKLKEDKTSKNPSFFRTKGRVMLSLSKDNCISELSQYADTPDCLLSFLDNVKIKFAA
jgi:hypothetical protein